MSPETATKDTMAAAWPASSFSFLPACGKVLVSTNEPPGLSRFAMASPDKTGSFLSAEILSGWELGQQYNDRDQKHKSKPEEP